ncbi:MAG: glycosyltransferase [Alphaproteobacteria bacterium]
MNLRVHILSDGFTSPNARAFAFPLLRHRRALGEAGIALKFFAQDTPDLTECDLLIVDSKHFTGPARGQPDHVRQALESYRAKCDSTVWFDTTDSAGWVFGGALETAKAYYKNQLLADRKRYLEPMHGRRAPSDFYHRHASVTDPQDDDAPQVREAGLLERLQVSWNSGLADYSRFGPRRMAAYRHLRCGALLQWPRRFGDPRGSRTNEVSCRFGTAYDRPSVAHQRLEIRRRLSDRMPTDKLGRGAYLHEMETSRVVVSPFGLGEITLKDFEVFLSGALLLKPDMSHMETWPDLFREGETMRAFNWDLDDLEATLANALADPGRSAEIAAAGQAHYRSFVNDTTGREAFVSRFREIVTREVA